MIDLHCHILHGMDDGPVSLHESVRMCRMAAADGTTTIVATPHVSPEFDPWDRETIRSRIAELKAALRSEGIPLTILPGADVAVFPGLPAHPGRNGFLSINNTPYLLLEFPHTHVPPSWKEFLRSLIDAGTTPVITHPERNEWFIRHPEGVEEAVRMGALVQITAESLLGGFGGDARKCGIRLLRSDLAHVMASDGHSDRERPPVMSKGVKAAADLIGEERARELVTTVPAAIIEGRPLRVREPRMLSEQRKGLLGMLTRMIISR
jgi:protein-tyrosine phosphatase